MTIERLRKVHEAAPTIDQHFRVEHVGWTTEEAWALGPTGAHGFVATEEIANAIVTEHNTYAALLDIAEAAETLLERDPTIADSEGLGGEWCHYCDKQTPGHEPGCWWADLRAALDRLDEVAP